MTRMMFGKVVTVKVTRYYIAEEDNRGRRTCVSRRFDTREEAVRQRNTIPRCAYLRYIIVEEVSE